MKLRLMLGVGAPSNLNRSFSTIYLVKLPSMHSNGRTHKMVNLGMKSFMLGALVHCAYFSDPECDQACPYTRVNVRTEILSTIPCTHPGAMDTKITDHIARKITVATYTYMIVTWGNTAITTHSRLNFDYVPTPYEYNLYRITKDIAGSVMWSVPRTTSDRLTHAKLVYPTPYIDSISDLLMDRCAANE
ncbi:hypothetical protein K504DRAFT_260610 [Pleomassaria siparia CBS 279.74]|uniref:Uncharacterized protein n=1 Tax=Pleomassaria siparia CBS 279.74 TaxID=1314801 RepID=A0A6G1KC50_9PLEO|nr:hypothetical protein K504DRAFT_260610 [Pleomassaria siparia CBS 279.74]